MSILAVFGGGVKEKEVGTLERGTLRRVGRAGG